MPDTLVIIPAYNEEHNIGKVLKDIEDTIADVDILVVNDGSSDKTGNIVRALGIDVISLPYNLGYGGALQTGFKYAVLNSYKYVIQFDADGQHDPEDITKIQSELRKGTADIVIGSRFLGGGSLKTGFVKRVAISLFRFLIRYYTGQRITDPTSGLKGLTRRTFSHYAIMGNYPDDFPDADILIQMIRSKYRVQEVPADMYIRDSGRSMHSGLRPIYYLIKILLCIVIVLLREKTLKEVQE